MKPRERKAQAPYDAEVGRLLRSFSPEQVRALYRRPGAIRPLLQHPRHMIALRRLALGRED